jgi:hypothetical protein
MKRKILLVLLVIFILIQIIRPEKNISSTASPNDIAAHHNVPADVLNILKRSCYDCHSNNTIYPWYNNIQPVAWWMADHVKGGKRELNFSEFAAYSAREQHHRLRALIGQVKKDEMPMDSYLWIHKYAKLNDAQKNAVIAWADSLQKSIAMNNNFPVDADD